ncbi:unnamed protein product [Anisakis simplex]|uniref:Uncharacterized protein n=1 Tax=Anisakis simplex TaxID=6269 RepID=A0A0M3J0Z8_ANISI|nr:unnamed protein product [Anisakis simplex]
MATSEVMKPDYDYDTIEDTSRVSATRSRQEKRVISDGQTEHVEIEERDQEEYFYTETTNDPSSLKKHNFTDGSETVSMNFTNDDRLLNNTVCFFCFQRIFPHSFRTTNLHWS